MPVEKFPHFVDISSTKEGSDVLNIELDTHVKMTCDKPVQHIKERKGKLSDLFPQFKREVIIDENSFDGWENYIETPRWILDISFLMDPILTDLEAEFISKLITSKIYLDIAVKTTNFPRVGGASKKLRTQWYLERFKSGEHYLEIDDTPYFYKFDSSGCSGIGRTYHPETVCLF